MKNIIFIIGIFLFLSCSQNKFYLEIERLNDRKLSKGNTCLINLRNHNNDIKNLNELVYYKSSYRNRYNGKLKTFHVIYDVENSTSFLTWFENKKEIFKENKRFLDSSSMKNINFFINKNFDEIKEYVLDKNENSSMPQARHEYYYINLDSIDKSYKLIIE